MGIKTKKVSYNAQRQTPCYYCYCFSATDRPVLKGQKSSLQTAIHQTQSDGSSDGSSSTSNEGTEIISTGAQKKRVVILHQPLRRNDARQAVYRQEWECRLL